MIVPSTNYGLMAKARTSPIVVQVPYLSIFHANLLCYLGSQVRCNYWLCSFDVDNDNDVHDVDDYDDDVDDDDGGGGGGGGGDNNRECKFQRGDDKKNV